METAHSAQQGGTFRRLLIFGALTLGLLALIASSVGATSAYFSDVDTGTVQVSTGEVSINTFNGDLAFTNLMPGDTASDSFTVRNTGTDAIDLYGWVQPEDNDGANLCGLGIEVRILGTGLGGVPLCSIAADLDNTFTGDFTDGDNAPVNLANGVQTGSSNQVTITVEIHVPTSVGNAADLEDSLTDKLVIYATQAGAPAPDFDTFNEYGGLDVFAP